MDGTISCNNGILRVRTTLVGITWFDFFHPGEKNNPQGIRALQPYDPDKIPVLLVHGLWSDPAIASDLSKVHSEVR